MADQTEPSTPPPASGGSGLDPKVAAGLAVISTIVIIGPIIFLVIEKKNSYVRFYAMQALVFEVAVIVLDVALMILARIPLLGALLSLVVGLGILALWIIQIIKAFSGTEWEIPYLGKMARNFLKSSPV